MRIEFDNGTLLLRNAPDDVPYAEWDDRVKEYRAQAYRYRTLLEWAGAWTESGSDPAEQASLQHGYDHAIEDGARGYADLHLEPALQIEPREYQLLDGPASLFRKSRKYGIRMANFLPALPHCNRWNVEAEILVDEAADETRQLTLDHTTGLQTYYSGGQRFDSDVERTLATKRERATTDWELVREDDVLDLGAEVILPDFAIEHPGGRRAVLEVVGFWTSEYLTEKLAKIRAADMDNLTLAVSGRLDCASEDFGAAAERVLWFKTGIHVYDIVDLAEAYAIQP